MKMKTCSSCKEKFQCEENQSCWCYKLPPVIINDNKDDPKDCVCPNCLEKRISK